MLTACEWRGVHVQRCMGHWVVSFSYGMRQILTAAKIETLQRTDVKLGPHHRVVKINTHAKFGEDLSSQSFQEILLLLTVL